MVLERKVAQNVRGRKTMRPPKLTYREYANLIASIMESELRLEIKGSINLTKQNLSKDVKPLDTKG